MASSKLLTQGRDRLSKAAEEDPASPAGTAPAERSGRGSAAVIVSPMTVPDPYAATEEGQLSASDRDYLATCEAAVDGLRLAFWAAGKALQVIRDARLYRETHGTFEDYVEQRWDMSRAQAYRLIDAWRLAERLSPIGDRLNEGQVRELLPLARDHGQDAALTVYSTVAETDGVHGHCGGIARRCRHPAGRSFRSCQGCRADSRVSDRRSSRPAGCPPTR